MSSIAVEQIEPGTFAVWDTDGRGRPTSDVYVGSAETADEARAAFLAARVYKIRDDITKGGTR